MLPDTKAVVVCEGVHKAFGPVHALAGADLTLPRGHVLGLLGENGAGKSTLVRLICGELAPDAGLLQVSGSVALVRQQLSMVPELTALENIVFGAEHGERRSSGWSLRPINWQAQRRRVMALAEKTGLAVPLDRAAGDLPAGLQQRAELLGALLRGADILLLDEPTTYLTPDEVDGLFSVIRGLTDSGVSTVFISHKLREVADHCDAVTVLRHGRTVAQFDQKPLDLAQVGRSMTGDAAPRAAQAPGARRVGSEAVIEAVGGIVRVHEGEIVGIAGVAGNGQDEMLATLAGLARHARYEPVIMAGTDVSNFSTAYRRRLGLGLIPASAKAAGTAVSATLTDNMLTAVVPERFVGPFGWLRHSDAERETEEVIAAAGIVAKGPLQLAGELSGGNLQKLVVARELGPGVKFLLAHEPTRGVDFAATAAIHDRLRAFTHRGGSILLMTSDLDELLALSHRVHILFGGRIDPAIDRSQLSLSKLGELLGGLRVASTGVTT